ncbi:MAG: porin [Zoogloeaceae bacterium]|jgi:predicted porin|nr:porin [Zoogloeaceae bacterium]
MKDKSRIPHLARLACSIAALASGAAMAQTNVQIYGTIDLGFAHRGDAITKGVGNQNAIDSGNSAGDRLGFRGTEDLGNGFKVGFNLEAGFNADRGVHPTQLFNRQAWLGLEGGFGTLRAGRQYTSHFAYAATLDPFAAGTVAEYRNLYLNIAGTTDAGLLDGLFDPTRVDNALTYISPSFAGFNVTAQASRQARGQEGTGNDGDLKYVSLFPRYVNGPIDIGAQYYRFKSDKYLTLAGVTNPEVKNWLVGGSYDFGVAKLSAFYDRSKMEADTAAFDGMTHKSWLIGARVPFGKHALLASWLRGKLARNGTSGVSSQLGLGYTYHFSKRTNFYAAWADDRNDRDRRVTLNSPTVAYDAGNGGPSKHYQNGFQFGLLHKF